MKNQLRVRAQGGDLLLYMRPHPLMRPSCTTGPIQYFSVCVCLKITPFISPIYINNQPPNLMLYEALMSPREEVTDVLPYRAQQLSFCFRGPNYLRSFPWPLDRGRKGYPHLISFTHQTPDSMERQERSIQHV